MDVFRSARQNFLRRQAEAEQADLERQEVREASSRRPEMQELQQQSPLERQPQARQSPINSVLRRFADLPRSLPSMPAMPSFAARPAAPYSQNPRPTSSRYDDDSEVVSPKTPQFALGMPQLPSTRLHIPILQRTWTAGSNAPAPPPASTAFGYAEECGAASAAAAALRQETTRSRRMPDIAEPTPAVPAEHYSSRNRGDTQGFDSTSDDRTSTSSQGHSSRSGRRGGRRRRFDGADPAEMHLANMADDGRRRRCRRHGRHDERSGRHNAQQGGFAQRLMRYAAGTAQPTARSASSGSRAAASSDDGRRKRFLFCFPFVKSRRMRAMILRSFVSGSFFALMLTVFIALLVTHNIYNSEFAVLLILILLLTAIFFFHSLVRICIMIVRPPTQAEEEAAEMRYRRRRHGNLPNTYGPGGYAIPRQPIRVVLARDEEAAGIESVTAKIQPPAYGLWRESVRVDPNRIYWQRSDDTTATASDGSSRSRDTSRNGRAGRDASTQHGPSETSAGAGSEGNEHNGGRQSPRPPSYMSDDGVQYVVEAQPRSIAPTTDAQIPQHPAEAGRIGQPAAW